MKNKILVFGIVLCMLFGLMVVPANAEIVANGTCGDNLTWALDDGGTLRISGTGDMTDYLTSFYLPWYDSRSSITTVFIDGGITHIGNYAFEKCYNLTNITIPNSVASIGKHAFCDCDSLTSVTIPNGVTSIEEWTFEGCIALTNITIPDSVTSIGNYAFSYCGNITNITIPNGVTDIGKHAFYDCSRLSSVTIPNGVTSIEDGAFFGCSAFTNITIPNSVTSIGTGAFNYCSSLTSITIPDSVTSIGRSAFANCNLTSINIPVSVTSIGEDAFSYCRNLTSISISESVTSIGAGAFNSCSSLSSINVAENNQYYLSQDGVLFNKDKTALICYPCGKQGSYTVPNSVTNIGYWAFMGCNSLTNVTIPDNVTSIGGGTFINCSNLTSINIPDNVTIIEGSTFAGCSSLTNITIPNNVTIIDGGAFYGCSSLTAITIPDSVTIIGEEAFYSCSSLTDVYYSGTAEDWNNISIDSYKNTKLTNATKHYNHIHSKALTNVHDYSGETLTILENGVLDIGENLYFRNGYVNAANGYIKAGDRKITGERIYFTNDGKMHLDADYTAKVERDNDDGTTSQGFMVGMNKPSGIITVNLKVTGTANDVDYTGRTISKEFDFTNYDINGLVNFGFTVNNIPKPLELYIESIE